MHPLMTGPRRPFSGPAGRLAGVPGCESTSMPTKSSDSIALEELLFPDDIQDGWVFEVKDAEDGEALFWDAEEVRDEIGEEHPEHGWWLRGELGGQGEKFLNAPEELREELQESVEEGDFYELTRYEKVEEHRIEVNVEPVDPEERDLW